MLGTSSSNQQPKKKNCAKGRWKWRQRQCKAADTGLMAEDNNKASIKVMLFLLFVLCYHYLSGGLPLFCSSKRSENVSARQEDDSFLFLPFNVSYWLFHRWCMSVVGIYFSPLAHKTAPFADHSSLQSSVMSVHGSILPWLVGWLAGWLPAYQPLSVCLK